MVRPRTSFSWPGLELSCHPGVDRKRDVLNAIPRAMVGVGETRRERDSSFFLVLEHWRQYPDVSLLSVPTRSGWCHRLSAELDHLHSESDADPKTASRLYR